MKKIRLFALKAFVSGLILTFLFGKIDPRGVIGHFQEMNGWYFGLASVLSLLIIFLASLRWWILLGKNLPIGRLFSLTLIGSFFNHLLPGSVGGDAVKTYYLFKETRQGGKSIASVFMDRYMGYAGLLSIGLVSGAIAFDNLKALRMQWITPMLFAAFLAGSLLVFGFRIGRRFSTLTEFYDYFHETLRNRRAILTAFLLSLAIQFLTILSIYLITLGIGQKPPLMALFVFVPVIITVAMVPVSISGLGLREGAFILLFGLIGIPGEASASISLLWYLSLSVASLPGIIVYLRLHNAPARK